MLIFYTSIPELVTHKDVVTYLIDKWVDKRTLADKTMEFKDGVDDELGEGEGDYEEEGDAALTTEQKHGMTIARLLGFVNHNQNDSMFKLRIALINVIIVITVHIICFY